MVVLVTRCAGGCLLAGAARGRNQLGSRSLPRESGGVGCSAESFLASFERWAVSGKAYWRAPAASCALKRGSRVFATIFPGSDRVCVWRPREKVEEVGVVLELGGQGEGEAVRRGRRRR